MKNGSLVSRAGGIGQGYLHCDTLNICKCDVHDLSEIEFRALELMRSLGEEHLGTSLLERGWTLTFNRARTRLGICTWTRGGKKVKTIALSRHYALHCGWEIMEDVVRHEIAHAIEFETAGRSGHGKRWKRIAHALGADPTRKYEGPNLPNPDSRYVGICMLCKGEVPFFRPVRRTYACPLCCKEFNRGRFDERFSLRIVERATGAELPRVRTRRPKYTATCPKCGLQRGYRQKPKRSYACRACCDRYSSGRFDTRFLWVITRNH